MLEGRSPDEIKALRDATQRTVVAAFKVPQPDRYQVVHEHPASHFIVEDTGLGIARTRNCVFLHVTTRGRDREAKGEILQPAMPRVGGDMRHCAVRRGRDHRDEHGRGLVFRERPCTVPDGRIGHWKESSIRIVTRLKPWC